MLFKLNILIKGVILYKTLIIKKYVVGVKNNHQNDNDGRNDPFVHLICCLDLSLCNIFPFL